MATEQFITTDDNPYNYFTEWAEWYAFDESQGHHTTGLVARFVVTSDALSDADQDDAIDTALKYIVDQKVYGPYKLVTSPT